MFRTRFVCLLAALSCILGLSTGVHALEVDCDTAYCFSASDFESKQGDLTGICITKLPQATAGTAMLGSRILRPGDILTAQQVSAMTFVPLKTETDQEAIMTYLPIYKNKVAPSATMTISIRGKEDKAPVAEDLAIETYKNLPNEAALKVKDPEGQKLVFTVIRQPRRGSLELNDDGTFLYTPKKNKVGVDTFTFTAADPAGNVSREATVTVTILKPGDAAQYQDTINQSCRFAAEWMKNTGIFVGEQIGGQTCFHPEKTVSRGEFLTMLIKALDIPVDQTASFTGYTDQVPAWLQPYLTTALRTGLTAGLPASETFGAEKAITGSEAAVMLQNALSLAVSTSAMDRQEQSDVPTWAEGALTALNEHGITLAAADPLTRGQAAQVLYAVYQISGDAPGLEVLRTAQ